MPIVEGFHIQKDGTRVSMVYNDHVERAWCECQELLDHKHYEEAYKKLNEYHDLNNGFIRKNDWHLILRVEMGYLSVKPTKKNFDNAVYAWNQSASHDDDKHKDLVYMGLEIIEYYEKFHNLPIEFDDFEKASVSQTIQLLEFIYSSFVEPGDDHCMNLEEYDFLEQVRFGIRHLAEEGEKVKAQAFYDKVKNVGFGANKRYMEENEGWMLNGEEDEEE